MRMIPGEPPPYLYHGPSILARFIFFTLLALLLLLVDARYQHLERLRTSIATALYPLQQIARWPRTATQEVAVYFANKKALEAQNASLTLTLLAQERIVQEAQTAQQENAQLKALLALREHIPRQAQAVEVLYGSRDPFVQKITIDKGQTQGIQEGSAVLDADGVIGQVTRTFPFTSEVTLLIEKNHTMPVRVERTGVRSVLYGMGLGQPLELRFVAPAADVRVGDRLLTSALESVYPPGLAVAAITAIDNDAEQSFAHITAEPVAGVHSRRYLLVVEPQNTAEPPAPMPAPEAPRRKKARR